MITWREATANAARVRSAFANGKPYSAIIVGLGSSFTYHEGILCYVSKNQLRALHLYEAITETVLDIPNLGNEYGDRKIQIVSSTMKNLIITYRDSQFQTSNLLSYLALDLDLAGSFNQVVKQFHTKIPYNSHSFIRQTESGAVYGYLSQSLNRWHGHRQWIFEYWRFSNLGDYKKRTLPTLQTHPGNDISSSVVFEIFDDKFYVISSQDSLTSEDSNPVSHYYVSCYPLSAEESQAPKSWKLWRRLHRAGPLDDNWTNLRLCRDESTGRLVIAETRKEWSAKLRNFKRTHYTQDLLKEADYGEVDSRNSEEEPGGSLISREIDDEYCTPPPDVIETAKIELERLLSRRVQQIAKEPTGKTWHSEYLGDSPPAGYREYLSSRVRYSAYNKSSAAYLDLVIDEELANSPRVRIQSRKKKPLPTESRPLTALTCADRQHTEGVGEEECYMDVATKLWPASNAPQQLLGMLNPTSQTSNVRYRAVSDERCLIYMAESPSEGSVKSQPIILISFDPSIRFEGLPQLENQWSPEDGVHELETSCQAPESEKQAKSRVKQKLTWQTVSASWRRIRQGFSLR